MATAAALFSRLRRSRPSSSLSLLSPPRVLSSPLPPPLPAPASPHSPTLAFLDAFRSRAFSSHISDNREPELNSFGVDSPLNSELLKVIADTSGGGEDDAVFSRSRRDFDARVVSRSFWISVCLLHSHRLSQERVIFKKRKAIGCPSYVWPLVPFIVQVPCFFLWMISIRKMSLDGHPGFDCGGALWFQNLTELSHGYSGFIFPFLIAGLHYVTVQISFRKPLVAETRDIFDLLAKFYKQYLDFLTIPIAITGFCIPQGSQLYWVTNSSLTLIQQITLRHPAVLAKLGLLDNSQKGASEQIAASKTAPSPGLQDNIPTAATKETVSPEKNPLDSPEKWHRIPIEEMSPKELLAVPFLNSDDKESAIPLLKLALDKDPDYVRALVLMGRVLLLKHVNDEANEYFERAISKLSLAGHSADAEEVDLLILSSQWAGIACERQGKRAEGRAHFERVANMQEPEDPTSKGYYFDGLLLLASTLFDAGQKAEAAKYLRLVVAYKPGYKKFLEQCEKDDDFTSDLARSRRDL
ncbi:ALBINO3-like protein 2, chloroplastic [Glycine max]|nr:ALBINO3-like protein 2, chloroplastic [Glycine max]